MAAFDKIKSGIPDMDQALDFIRLGDNVVWRVSHLEEFRLFMEPYIEQAKRDHRNIIYFRFASHEPLIPECREIKTVMIPLSHRSGSRRCLAVFPILRQSFWKLTERILLKI
jgi:hypothetical protein